MTNEQQWILIIFYLSLLNKKKQQNNLNAAEGRARIGSMILWSMESTEIWIASTPGNNDKVSPETGGRMSLKYELTKGHLTTSWNQTNPGGFDRHASCILWTGSLFWKNPSQLSVTLCCFETLNGFKREPAYISVVNQYSLELFAGSWCCGINCSIRTSHILT